VPPVPADVDVAVVSFNGRGTLPRLLECLAASNAPRERITVYDVASTDDTGAWLAAEWPGVRVHRLPVNNGPDPGRNLALRECQAPYLLLLDADAFVRPDMTARLREALDPAAGIACTVPVVVHAHQPDMIQYAGGSMHFICEAVNPSLDRPLAARGTDRRDIGAAPGVAYLIDVAISKKIGDFDDRYFIGKEDGDFCHRLVMAGYRLVEDGSALVEHRSRPRTAWLFPCQIRNRWHFLLKNYELRTVLLMIPALLIHEPVQFAMIVVKGHFGAYRRAVRELIPWLKTLRQERREIAAFRRKPDGALFMAAPLVVRQEFVGGRLGRAFKSGYDAWLRAYWALIKPFVS
jgi:hypothetical protein